MIVARSQSYGQVVFGGVSLRKIHISTFIYWPRGLTLLIPPPSHSKNISQNAQFLANSAVISDDDDDDDHHNNDDNTKAP